MAFVKSAVNSYKDNKGSFNTDSKNNSNISSCENTMLQYEHNTRHCWSFEWQSWLHIPHPKQASAQLAWIYLFTLTFWQSIFTHKVGHTDLIFVVPSGFISRYVHARLQVSVCSDYDLHNTDWHLDTQTQTAFWQPYTNSSASWLSVTFINHTNSGDGRHGLGELNPPKWVG